MLIIIIILIIIFISVKTNRSTNMITGIYIYIHEHLSCRTGTTGLASQSLARWRHQGRHRIIVLLLIYLPRKDERLSWPSWLTCSGRITHIVVTRWLQAEHRTGSVRRPKTDVLPTVLRMNDLLFPFFPISVTSFPVPFPHPVQYLIPSPIFPTSLFPLPPFPYDINIFSRL